MPDSEGELPRKVYRVLKCDGKYVVAERMLIGRSGSWYTYQQGDKTVKENGLYWRDTIMSALQVAAENALQAAYMSSSVPHMFAMGEQFSKMCDLLDEAYEWGRLVGDIEATTRKK